MAVNFPERFLWGAATSAFQVEGADAADGKGSSIWDEFCQWPGKVAGGATGQVTCDHYRRFRDDVELMRRLNLRAYRFSVSWPRVMPAGRGAVNAAGLDFYDRLVDELQTAGIQPLATLYHWDLPAVLQAELGGWTSAELPAIFADYARQVFDRLGDRVGHWLTVNEPWVVVNDGYFRGVHAPGIQDRALGYVVGHNLLRAHAYAVAQYRAGRHNQGAISFALNTTYNYPASDSMADTEAAERATLNFGGWFTDPPYFGDYPAVLRERLGALLPPFSPEDSRLLKRSMDFVGLNYYSSDVVRHAPGVGAMELEVVPQRHVTHTQMGWPVVPDGLRRLLHWLHERYAGLPIYVTENGAAFDDQPSETGLVNDLPRITYLRDHIAAVGQALAEGVDVRGYFVWSLFDNLEWSYGFTKRFGIVRCDPETQHRTIKASGHWYARFITEGRLDDAGVTSPECGVEVSS